VKWNLSVVLIFLSFIARNGEHFFMHFLAIWISSFGKCSVQFSCTFLYWFIDFGEFSFLSSLYILGISPLSDV
jgi:hypothetical protein